MQHGVAMIAVDLEKFGDLLGAPNGGIEGGLARGLDSI